VVDGVFEAVAGDDDAKGSKVKFQALAHLIADVIAQVQNEAKRCILLAFVKCRLLEFKNQPCQRAYPMRLADRHGRKGAWNMRVGRAVFLLLPWLYAREHARMTRGRVKAFSD
jgi:hypothetical protein